MGRESFIYKLNVVLVMKELMERPKVWARVVEEYRDVRWGKCVKWRQQ
jgi:hypothetical protein